MASNETITITGRKERVDPEFAVASGSIFDDGVRVRVDDMDNPAFWMHVHLPARLILEWADALLKRGNDVSKVTEAVK